MTRAESDHCLKIGDDHDRTTQAEKCADTDKDRTNQAEAFMEMPTKDLIHHFNANLKTILEATHAMLALAPHPADARDNRGPAKEGPKTIATAIEWCLIPVFCSLTGYTDKAVRRKIADGIWIQGRHYKRAPDGHITMNLQAYYKWVQGV